MNVQGIPYGLSIILRKKEKFSKLKTIQSQIVKPNNIEHPDQCAYTWHLDVFGNVMIYVIINILFFSSAISWKIN